VFADVDGLLRAEGRYASTERVVPLGRIVTMIVVGGFCYGVVMGSFAGRPLQAIYSGLKVPLLLLGTSAIVLPNFYVINTLLGLRDDFAAALRGIFAAQAIVAITLVALSPLTIVGYVSFPDYADATRVNFVLFGLATLAGHVGCEKFYRGLLARNPRHQVARYTWTALYVFVAIQLAWVFRPFVGDPRRATEFFRDDAWSNAYVVVGKQIFGFGY
jgi:hypothetical protein